MDIIVTISMRRLVSTNRGVTLQNDHHRQISVGLHKFYDEVPPYLMKSRTSYREITSPVTIHILSYK